MCVASDKLSRFACLRGLFLNYATIYTSIATELCHLPEGLLPECFKLKYFGLTTDFELIPRCLFTFSVYWSE